MKKWLFLLIIIPFWSFSLAQSQAQIRESLPFPSKTLARDMSYSVYLPAGYELHERQYPVLYLLHGRTGNEKDWIQFGNLAVKMAQAMEEELLVPMVIVMPQAFDSYYCDSYDDQMPYEKYFFEEFIPFIEKTYRIRATREFRAIAGLSMGGYGALHYCMKHPEMFISCGALSAAVYSDEAMANMATARYEEIYAPMYGRGLVGEARLSESWRANSPFHLLQAASEEDLKSIRWYIDCGDDDYLNIGNSLLHMAFLQRKIPHEFRVRDGAHDWSYWRKTLIPCLTYICKPFQR